LLSKSSFIDWNQRGTGWVYDEVSCDLLSKSSFIDWNQQQYNKQLIKRSCDLLSKSSFIDWNQLSGMIGYHKLVVICFQKVLL